MSFWFLILLKERPHDRLLRIPSCGSASLVPAWLTPGLPTTVAVERDRWQHSQWWPSVWSLLLQMYPGKCSWTHPNLPVDLTTLPTLSTLTEGISLLESNYTTQYFVYIYSACSWIQVAGMLSTCSIPELNPLSLYDTSSGWFTHLSLSHRIANGRSWHFCVLSASVQCLMLCGFKPTLKGQKEWTDAWINGLKNWKGKIKMRPTPYLGNNGESKLSKTFFLNELIENGLITELGQCFL